MVPAIVQAMRPFTYTVRYSRKWTGKPLLYISGAMASLGDGLFGYSQGVTAASQVQPNFIRRMYGKHVTLEEIQLRETEIPLYLPAIMVASLNITALFGALGSAYLSDYFGRRISIRIGACIYLIASIIQMFSTNLTTPIIGRMIQGFGTGILSTAVPIFQSEIAPRPCPRNVRRPREFLDECRILCLLMDRLRLFFRHPRRGLLAGTVRCAGAHLSHLGHWHIFFGRDATLAHTERVQDGGAVDPRRPPRSGRRDGRRRESHVLRDPRHPGGRGTERGHCALGRPLQGVHTTDGHRMDSANVRAAQRHQRASPFFARDLNARRSQCLAGLVLLCHLLRFYLLGTLPAILYIDKFGRRRSLLAGSVALAVSLTLVGCLKLYIERWSERLSVIGGAHGVFAGMCIYFFFFASTWGPVPWILNAELFPLKVRAKGMAITTVSDWLFEFLVAFWTPPLFECLRGAYYFLLVGSCIVSGLVVWLVYVETGNQTLEEIGGMFGDETAPPRILDSEDPILNLRRRRARGHSTVSMSSQITAVTHATAATSHLTLHTTHAHGRNQTGFLSPQASSAATSQVTLTSVPEDAAATKKHVESEKDV